MIDVIAVFEQCMIATVVVAATFLASILFFYVFCGVVSVCSSLLGLVIATDDTPDTSPLFRLAVTILDSDSLWGVLITPITLLAGFRLFVTSLCRLAFHGLFISPPSSACLFGGFSRRFDVLRRRAFATLLVEVAGAFADAKILFCGGQPTVNRFWMDTCVLIRATHHWGIHSVSLSLSHLWASAGGVSNRHSGATLADNFIIAQNRQMGWVE